MQQAFDSAVYVGANLLGIRVDRPPPPTLTQYLQAAALGVLTAGGSEKFGNAPTDRIASLMIRGQIREQCGVPLGSAESVHTAQVAEHLAAQGVAGDPQRLAMLTAPLTAEEEAAYRELAPRVAQIRASGKMPPPQSAARVSDDGKTHGDFTAYGDSGAASPSGPAGSGAKAPNLVVTGPDGFVAGSTPPAGGSASGGHSPSSGAPDSLNPADPPIPGLDTKLPSAVAPAKGGDESPADPPIPGLDTKLPSAVAAAKGGSASPAVPPIPGLPDEPAATSPPTAGAASPASRAWGDLRPEDLNQEIELPNNQRGILDQITPTRAIYRRPGNSQRYGIPRDQVRALTPPEIPGLDEPAADAPEAGAYNKLDHPRLPGVPFNDFDNLRQYLSQNDIHLSLDPEPLKRERASGAFVIVPNQRAILYLHPDATVYEALHEVGHARDWISKGKPATLDTSSSEQAAYDYLRSTPGVWDYLNPGEQLHAGWYVKKHGGNPW